MHLATSDSMFGASVAAAAVAVGLASSCCSPRALPAAVVPLAIQCPRAVQQSPTVYLPLTPDVRRQVVAEFRAQNPGIWGFIDERGGLRDAVGTYMPVLLRGVRGGTQGRARLLRLQDAVARARGFLVANARFFGMTPGEATSLSAESEPSDRAPEGPLIFGHRQGEWRDHTYVWFRRELPWPGAESFPEITREPRIAITIGIDGEVTRFEADGGEFLPPRFAAVPAGVDDLRLARTSLRGASLIHRWRTQAPPHTPAETPGFVRTFTGAFIVHERLLAPIVETDVERVEACVHTERSANIGAFVRVPCLHAWIAKDDYRFTARIDRNTGARLVPIEEIGTPN